MFLFSRIAYRFPRTIIQVPGPFRCFGGKKSQISLNLSEYDKRKLEQLFRDQEICEALGLRYYQINEEIDIEGDANVINWNDRLIGSMTVEQARSLAQAENLDLVLMTKNPLTLRIMNYFRFILGDLSTQTNIGHTKGVQGKSKYQISNNIAQHDLQNKVKKIKNQLPNNSSVTIDVSFRIIQNDPLQLTKAEEIASEIEEMLEDSVQNFTLTKENRKSVIRLTYLRESTPEQTTQASQPSQQSTANLNQATHRSKFRASNQKHYQTQHEPVGQELSDEEEIMDSILYGINDQSTESRLASAQTTKQAPAHSDISDKIDRRIHEILGSRLTGLIINAIKRQNPSNLSHRQVKNVKENIFEFQPPIKYGHRQGSMTNVSTVVRVFAGRPI